MSKKRSKDDNELTRDELRDVLREVGLSGQGSKQELLERWRKHKEQEEEEEEEEEEELQQGLSRDALRSSLRKVGLSAVGVKRELEERWEEYVSSNPHSNLSDKPEEEESTQVVVVGEVVEEDDDEATKLQDINRDKIRGMLRRVGLSDLGTKEELIKRYEGYLKSTSSSSENSTAVGDEQQLTFHEPIQVLSSTKSSNGSPTSSTPKKNGDMTRNDLREALRLVGLSGAGSKLELQKRYSQYLVKTKKAALSGVDSRISPPRSEGGTFVPHSDNKKNMIKEDDKEDEGSLIQNSKKSGMASNRSPLAVNNSITNGSEQKKSKKAKLENGSTKKTTKSTVTKISMKINVSEDKILKRKDAIVDPISTDSFDHLSAREEVIETLIGNEPDFHTLQGNEPLSPLLTDSNREDLMSSLADIGETLQI